MEVMAGREYRTLPVKRQRAGTAPASKSVSSDGEQINTLNDFEFRLLQNVPAQILIFHNVREHFADIISVHGDVLAFSVRRRKADLIEHAFHNRVQSPRADVFRAFVYAKREARNFR